MHHQPLSSEYLLTDLMYLRKGEGMTPRRLAHAGLVDQVLRSSAEDSYELKKQRLISAIQSLHEPDADILMAAFGLDSSTAGLTSLKQRRVVYGQRIERGIDTVGAREAKALGKPGVHGSVHHYVVKSREDRLPTHTLNAREIGTVQ